MLGSKATLLLLLGVALCHAASVPRNGSLPRFPGLKKILENRRLRYVPPPPEKLQNDLHAIDTLTFDQVLDHFNPVDKRTWKQRYFSRSDLYQEGGPVFIYIGGEGQEDASTLSEGALLMTYLAKTFKAKLYDLEHRYYGESHPTPDLSSANLRYLSADQALADLAYFIEYLIKKGDMKAGQKVVVFGGSYPGNLAAWARLKYPHLINAAVSSSGPVHAEADFVEYMEVVSRSLSRVAGKWCDDNVKMATDRIVKLLQTTDGYEQVRKTFSIGSELKNKLDLDTFFLGLSNPFASAVQYNTDSPTSSSIQDVCSYMQGDNLTPDEAVEKLARLVVGGNSGGQPMDWSYQGTVDLYSKVEYQKDYYGEYDAMRQWTYQTCTEFGYFQTFSGSDVPFPKTYNDVSFSYQLCKDLFGDAYDGALVASSVERTNTEFGDRKPDVTNVIFVNGNIDPWHALGILSDISPDAQAIIVDGGSHCADMSAPRSSDSQEITAAHTKVHEFLQTALYDKPAIVA